MALPTSFYSLTFNDNTVKDNGKPESTSFEVAITTLTPANVAAQETLAGDFRTAIAGITIGEMAKDTLIYDRDIMSTSASPDELAQRENKWLCRYHDAVLNTNYQVSIGTADLAVKVAHKEYIDLTAGVGLAFKTAFEAFVKSPADPTHATVLDSVTFVGRNT